MGMGALMLRCCRSNWSCGGSTAAPREPLSMLSFPPSNLRNSKRRAVVESGECWACIRRYFLRIWPATLVGEVPRLEEVLGLEIDFLRLDGISILKLVALVFLAAISRENVLSNVRNHTVHAFHRHYAVNTCAIGSCMPSRRLRRLDAPLAAVSMWFKRHDIIPREQNCHSEKINNEGNLHNLCPN